MRTFSIAFLGGIVGTVFTSMIVVAWTGPASAPPNGNVSAPINIGTTDQIKNAGIGINSLAVFGNAILSGASRYLNFGSTAGPTGYGLRDNAGIMEVKNNAGSWNAMLSASSTFSQIKFADGTTQTTAAAGVTQEATTFCTVTSSRRKSSVPHAASILSPTFREIGSLLRPIATNICWGTFAYTN